VTPAQTKRLNAYLSERPMSKGLRGFLADWLADTTRPWWKFWGRHYSRSIGLCGNNPRGTSHELDDLLYATFGTSAYPFKVANYYSRKRRRTQHLDPKRLAFVRACLAHQSVRERAS